MCASFPNGSEGGVWDMIVLVPDHCLHCFVVVVALLFYVHGKHLRSCRDGQLT